MKFLSICSGIEAASVAWRPIGWEAVGFSEIEPFPCEVLRHHYPDVPNFGDMTKFMEWPDATIDVLCGGTPCQSFSVAGLRKGLDDPRGNLMLTFLAIAKRYRPSWVVWENVPGVLSSNGGRDFGSFLGGLAECGYGFAYRVLDAQYFGVAQRRKRVFVVGYLGDWHPAAAVLFERHSLQGHPAPRRETRKVASTIPARSTAGGGLGTDFDCDGGLISMCLTSGGGQRLDAESETLIPTIGGGFNVAHSLRGEGFDASEDGTGRGTPLVSIAFSIMPMNSGKDYKAREVDVAQPLMAGGPVGGNQGGDFIAQPVAIQGTVIGRGEHAGPKGSGTDTTGAMFTLTKADVHAVAQPIGFNARQDPDSWSDRAGPLDTDGGTQAVAAVGMQVRRLTPIECERLQGFPDNYTAIHWRNKPADQCPDGPRYKALGNSWAVPVAQWIGKRINAVTETLKER